MSSPASTRRRQIHLISLLVVTCAIFPLHAVAQDAPQDAEEQKRTGFIYFPIIFSTPETGFALGSAFGIYYRDPSVGAEGRPSTITPMIIFTQKKQIMSNINLDLYLKQEAYRLNANFGFQKYPDKFYGIGNDLPETNEEDFTSRKWLILLDFQRRIRPGLNIGIQYEQGRSRIIDIEENGILDPGGTPPPPLGNEGGRISGAGLILNWDTRDNIFYPSSGLWYQLSTRSYGSDLGSDFSYSRYNLDARQYFQIRPSHILACQAYLNVMTGTPPFELMSRLGGPNIMRGYYMGRYSDKCMIALQAEYRMQIRPRIGVVGFAGFGDVAREIGEFSLGDFKPAFGLGLRFLFSPEEKINLRLDFAGGDGSSGMYISIQEAF